MTACVCQNATISLCVLCLSVSVSGLPGGLRSGPVRLVLLPRLRRAELSARQLGGERWPLPTTPAGQRPFQEKVSAVNQFDLQSCSDPELKAVRLRSKNLSFLKPLKLLAVISSYHKLGFKLTSTAASSKSVMSQALPWRQWRSSSS